jgi:hypothetical protein
VVLRKELPDLSSTFDELEFAAQGLKANCVFYSNFRRLPLDRREKRPDAPFGSTRANPVGLSQQFCAANKQVADRNEGPPPDLERLALGGHLRRAHRFVDELQNAPLQCQF